MHVENQTIYHAGDLNWWHWQGEPQADNDYQRRPTFKKFNLLLNSFI